MNKKILKIVLGIIIFYPFLYFIFYFDNMSFKRMPDFYWLLVLIADVVTICFLSLMEYFYYKNKKK